MLMPDCNHEFSYLKDSLNGPTKWGSLGAQFKSCSDGESQSPINIEAKKAKDQPYDLKKSYKEAPAKLFNRDHAITVEWQGDAGGIEVNGTAYQLFQCHWHIPSEHTINGKKHDAEIHFVHIDGNDQKAVIGYLYTIGKADPFIEKLSESKLEAIDSNGNALGKISASSATSGSKKYYRYRGSLTTPPCSEGVTWTVADTTKSISKEQIELLKGPLDHGFKENARPVQELRGRTVTKFEDKEETGEGKQCGKDSSSSIIHPRNGIIIILIHIYVLLLFYVVAF
ncbi:putative carbonic anhydrase [Helianthus annuus]|nr:putative carbonic anhydrase [Helianthus annuus]